MKSHNVRILGGFLLALCATHAQADDMTGVLNVKGGLSESPCSLEMTSRDQTVDLGNVSRNLLQRPGDRATAKAFQLRFLNCQRTAGSTRSVRTGNLSWGATQPVLSVAFIAPADADDPRLVKVQGITGMGLLLTDALGRVVNLGARSEPLFLAVGNDTLTWSVQPTRTSAPLSNGAFRAVVDFRLNYD